jgi:glycine hydroxymethyltransferase
LLSLNLAAGGHLSHGASPNQSGRWFDAQHYGVDRESGLIDYEQVTRMVREIRPALLIAGGSAYPRHIDFERMRHIADSVNALLLVDMAHFAGLVAAGAHPSPLPHADIVTCTTTKTLRGPRGGLILARDSAWAQRMNSAIFPGVQGSLHSQIIAAKAVCLGEALGADFRRYGHDVVANAQTLAAALTAQGIRLVSGGTDTHMLLLDLSPRGLRGQQLQDSLAEVNLTSNKNPIPYDSAKPAEWAGLRLGVGAATTRGLQRADFTLLGEIIARAIARCGARDPAGAEADRGRVLALCERYPIYP